MSWYYHYGQRMITANEAVELIKPGDRVVLGNAVGEPQALLSALLARAGELRNVEVIQFLSLNEINANFPTANVTFNTFMINKLNRTNVYTGYVNFIPCSFFDIPGLFKQNLIPVDIAMIQLSLPDENGYCSLGVSVDFTKTLIASSKITIAEVNPNMPRTRGDSMVHVSNIDYFIPHCFPLKEVPREDYGPVEKAIGLNVAGLIEDGSTIQLGTGPIMEAVIDALKDKNDLGVHSDVISDGVVELIESGVVNGKKKTLHPGKVVGSFLVGTNKLYNLANENPAIELYPIEYTNDPVNIGLNEKMISISSAFQIDLMGQIYLDSVCGIQVGSGGGSVDFIRGASRSKGGKSIIALPSTAAGGEMSRIVIKPDISSAVSVPRYEAHYVVTEHGSVNLKGKTLRQRAEALISISHPNFRDYLSRAL